MLQPNYSQNGKYNTALHKINYLLYSSTAAPNWQKTKCQNLQSITNVDTVDSKVNKYKKSKVPCIKRFFACC